MKKLLTLTFTVISLLSLAQEKNFNISITVKGMENKEGILAYYYGEKRFVKDTIKFNEKGTAAIKGKLNFPAGVYLVALPAYHMSSFDVIIKEPEFSMVTDTFDLVRNMTVKNSIENKEMYEDMHYMAPLGIANDTLQRKLRGAQKTDSVYVQTVREIDRISKKIVDHRKDLIKKYPSAYYTKLVRVMLDLEVPEGPRKKNGSLVDTFYTFHYTQQHYFDNIDWSDSGMIRSPVFIGRLTKYFDNYVFPHPDSIMKAVDLITGMSKVNAEMYQTVVNELFMKYAKSEIMGQDAVYVYMADKFYLSGAAWWVDPSKLVELRDRVEAIKPTLIGKITPNFIVQDSLGKTQVFHDFIPKNKFTLLIFWNSDCGHCQHEMPRLKTLYTDSLKALGVRVFAVSTEQTDSSFRAFAAKNCSPDWITGWDVRGVSAFRKEYDVIATPKVFLITPDYKIIAKNIPLDNIVDFIKFEEAMIERQKSPSEER